MKLEVKSVLPRFFFDLLGRSIILLCNLIPRTLYIAYVTSGTAQQYCDVAEVFKCIMPRLVDCILLVGRRSDPFSDILQFQCFLRLAVGEAGLNSCRSVGEWEGSSEFCFTSVVARPRHWVDIFSSASEIFCQNCQGAQDHLAG